jgi:hypothetical protein
MKVKYISHINENCLYLEEDSTVKGGGISLVTKE